MRNKIIISEPIEYLFRKYIYKNYIPLLKQSIYIPSKYYDEYFNSVLLLIILLELYSTSLLITLRLKESEN